MAADHAHYLAPFARLLVVFEDVRFKNTDDARRKLEALHQQFPNNHLFQDELDKLGRTSAHWSVRATEAAPWIFPLGPF